MLTHCAVLGTWYPGLRIGFRRGGSLSVVVKGAHRGGASSHNAARLVNFTRKGYVGLHRLYIHLYMCRWTSRPILYLGCHGLRAYRSEALRKASAVS